MKTTQMINSEVNSHFLHQTCCLDIVTSSVVVDTTPISSDFGMAIQKNIDPSHREFCTNCQNLSSSVAIYRPDEAYQITRIMSGINASQVNSPDIKSNLNCFLEAFKRFLIELPPDIRSRIPNLSMQQDPDGDCIVIWATRKANAIFDISSKWKDSFWCATGEQEMESAPLSKDTLGDGINKSYNILLPYV